MPPRKKGAKVKSFTTGRSHGRGRDAAAQGSPEEPAPVVEDAPAASESEAESTAPPPASQIDIVAEVHQPAEQSSSDSDELPPSEAAKSQKKRKRELVTAGFTKEQEQEMVDWLKAPEQDCILNKKHPNYIKKGLKDTLWEQKAREMDKTSDLLKKWYANMRSRFGKLKQTPSGSGDIELTARDRWILCHFEFLRPHLIVQVKKRVTVSMKAKVQARAAPAATAGAPQSESDAADHHTPTAAQSDTDTSLGSRGTDDTEATRSNIAELQRQLLNKLFKAEKSPLQCQKDTFAHFMKEVTYTFPPPMWLRFQSEVNSLLQKYQFEFHQVPPTQTQQQQDEFLRPYAPAPIPGPSSQQCPSMGWQPHPSQWLAQNHQPTSVWGPQEASWVQRQFQQEPPVRPQSAPPTYSASTPLLQTSSTSIQSQGMGNFGGLSGFSSGSYNSFTQLLNTNQDDDNQELNTPHPVVHSPTPTQQSEQSEQGDGGQE
ncbi:uncharacterized protein LOC132887758 [Neoarius graeffei]|uniref:uncharacterized protein LOC132887758 n=1 Tax=Neoarius graeffei TaxID=443677 RepID=UPI00298C4975|nr:uncharacterized protein LOC132887758 [Neoarius graeffei]